MQLLPSSVVADGSSTSTAVATVTDAKGNPVRGAKVVFSASDSGVGFGPVTDQGDGTYTSTVTSSAVAGPVSITATDTSVSPPVSGSATLTQTLAGTPTSTTSLIVLPNAPVTNEKVTLIATTTASASDARPSGTIAVENHGQAISGCVDPLTPVSQSVTVTCETVFSAVASPAQLTAVFTPSPGSAVGGSNSPIASVAIGQDGTSTALGVSNPAISPGVGVTYTATVSPDQLGAVYPSGTVDFLDAGHPISGCLNRPLANEGSLLTATCTVSYETAGSHSITARYDGDTNFRESVSPAQPVEVQTLPARAPTTGRLPARVVRTVTSTVRWTFYYTPSATFVRKLVVKRAPVAATILVVCRGKGCPFAKRVTRVPPPANCQTNAPGRCLAQSYRTIDLSSLLRNDPLYAGSQFTIVIRRSGLSGKYYRFTVRAGRPPRIQIACLPSGTNGPAAGSEACS